MYLVEFFSGFVVCSNVFFGIVDNRGVVIDGFLCIVLRHLALGIILQGIVSSFVRCIKLFFDKRIVSISINLVSLVLL